jgi:hypothetical protein
MLEQAVIDAQALKEAAIKNAEQEVLEKYAGEIKETVNALLEQEADPMAADPMAADPMAEAPVAGETGEDPNAFLADVPLKAMDGVEISESDAGDEIDLDLDALVKTLAEEEPAAEMAAPDLTTDPMMAQDPVADAEQIMYEAVEKA